ncbi:MAG: hypothetical protein ACRDGJ_03720, partial [Candidatus Limnocylindria bacterium]
GLYRAAMLLDALGWVGIGGLFLWPAMLMRRGAPVRCTIAAVCGIAMLTGVIGGFLRLTATGDLGARLAAGEDQNRIVEAYRLLDQIISAHFTAGQPLQGAGFLLVASVALASGLLPRRLALALAVPGITSLTIFTVELVLNVFPFPLLIAHILITAAVSLWLGFTASHLARSAPSLTSSSTQP